jgi:NADP-dependent 3-hydroxy acid dehydrogenase YdfG
LHSSHNVVAVARSKAPLEELKSRYPQQVQFITGDLAQFNLAQETVDLTLKEFGKIDGLIINHGVLDPVATVGNSEPEAWKEAFDINFFSAIAFVSG